MKKLNKLAFSFFPLFLFGILLSAQTNNYFGTSGTLSSNVWSTNAGGPYTSAFVTTGGGIANFNNAGSFNGGSITIAGINASASLTIGSTGGTISNASNGIITVNISNSAVLDFAGQSWTSSATAGYIKTGNGTWALAGNTYSGGFTLNDGIVIVRGVNALGQGGSLTINGGTLASNANRDLSGKYFGGITIGGDFTIGASTGLASNTATLTFTNNMALGSNTSRAITLGNDATHTFGGVISGSSSSLAISATGTGTLSLTGANTYNGGTTINSGTLALGAAGVIANTCPINVNGGTLSCSTFNETIGALTLTSGSITGGTGTLTPSSTAVQSGTINKIIGGTGTLTKTTSGTVTMSTSNTFTGKTTISEGFIATSGESAFGANPGSFVADQITLNGGGITTTGNIDFNSNRGLTLGASGGTFNASGFSITLTNVVTGSGALTKTGTGTLTAAGVHTYTGATNINGGILNLFTGNNRLPTGTAVTLANAASTSLSLVTFNQTIGSLSGGGSSGGNVSLGSGTLTVGDGNSTTYDGVISGTGGLVKQGSGTLTLSRANTYSGNTTINAGTLEIGASNVLPTAPFILAGGTLSTGSGAGFSETVGTLQLTASSTIALGSGVHTLTFANSSAVSWTAGQTLTITGWTGTEGASGTAGRILVGTGGLTAAQLAQVSFTGYTAGGAIVAGELVPASALPIKLINFSATRQNNQAQLTFSTATEENNNFFAIERSSNGTDFRTIGKVNGAGTTTSIQNYSFTDETPLSGINYYRLKQVDFDGQFTYSPVVTVAFDNNSGLRLTPTPVQDQLRIELDAMFQEDAQWQLYDFAGRLVQTGVLAAENTVFNVEVGSLTPGNYVIRVVSGQTTLTKQFQK